MDNFLFDSFVTSLKVHTKSLGVFWVHIVTINPDDDHKEKKDIINCAQSQAIKNEDQNDMQYMHKLLYEMPSNPKVKNLV